MKLVSALLVTFCVIASHPLRADIVYSYTADFSSITGTADSTITWSFSEPTFLTSNTTVTSFITASLGSGFSSCGTIASVLINNPTSTAFPGFSAPEAETDFSGTCDGGFAGAATYFNLPLTSDGTYSGFSHTGAALDATLTITGTPAVPEPTTAMLLASGLWLGALREKIRRR